MHDLGTGKCRRERARGGTRASGVPGTSSRSDAHLRERSQHSSGSYPRASFAEAGTGRGDESANARPFVGSGE